MVRDPEKQRSAYVSISTPPETAGVWGVESTP
jgi:hypothetical protein